MHQLTVLGSATVASFSPPDVVLPLPFEFDVVSMVNDSCSSFSSTSSPNQESNDPVCHIKKGERGREGDLGGLQVVQPNVGAEILPFDVRLQSISIVFKKR